VPHVVGDDDVQPVPNDRVAERPCRRREPAVAARPVTHGIYWILANSLPGASVTTSQISSARLRDIRLPVAGESRGRGSRGLEYDGTDEVNALKARWSRRAPLVEAKARRLLLNVREIGGETELRAAVKPGLEEAATSSQPRSMQGAAERSRASTRRRDRYYPSSSVRALPSHPLALRLYEEIIHKGGVSRGG